MTGETRAQLIEENRIVTGMRKAGITKALIIDDAYDLPTQETHKSEISEFWGTIERDENLIAELLQLKPDLVGEDDVDDELLSLLWNKRNELPRLKKIIHEVLFIGKISDRAILKGLEDYLSLLEITPYPIGIDDDEPLEEFKLIFIDYFLGPDAVLATTKAKNLYNRAGNDKKPFIVLMSNKGDAYEAKDVFRKESGILGGLFGYFPKSDMNETGNLDFHFMMWALGMPRRHEIQRFVDALEEATKVASKRFIEYLRDLSFEDYVNIASLSLKKEGHPLGDYMLWLFKSLFAYLLHDNPNVIAEQKKLDSLTFDNFVPSQSNPSKNLTEIYCRALLEPAIEDVTHHPQDSEESQLMLLHLGDLFINDETKDVRMVINAPCDLAFAPKEKRRIPEDQSILMMHGKLQPYEKPEKDDKLRTAPFRFETTSEIHQILWFKDQVTSEQYIGVDKWRKNNGYKRMARLSLPYALQLQQAFAMYLMRIGIPVGPPLCQDADVEIYTKGNDLGYKKIGDSIFGGANIYKQKNDDKIEENLFILTPDCIRQIVEKVSLILEDLKKELQLSITIRNDVGLNEDSKEVEKEKVKERQAKKLILLEKLKQMTSWMPLLEELNQLPSAGKVKKFKDKICIYNNHTFSGDFNESSPIVLNIKMIETSDGAKVSQLLADKLPETQKILSSVDEITEAQDIQLQADVSSSKEVSDD